MSRSDNSTGLLEVDEVSVMGALGCEVDEASGLVAYITVTKLLDAETVPMCVGLQGGDRVAVRHHDSHEEGGRLAGGD